MAIVNRLPTAFHETFAMKRVAVSQVVDVLSKVSDPIVLKSRGKREEVLRQQTSLGTNYVKSMPNYARGVGLLSDAYIPTDLCNLTQSYDRVFDLPSTQWLLHYHMSASAGPGPEFWHEFVTKWFRTGNKFSKSELRSDLGSYFLRSKGKKASDSTLDGSINAFLNTYLDLDCFGRLGILEVCGSEFEVQSPTVPPAWVFAYALVDYWETHCNGRISINLSELTTTQHGLASLFLLDASTVDRLLSELQQSGFVEVYRAAQPYQLLLLSTDKALALRKLYGAT